jgi:peptide/nickel transport system permease protein
VGERVPRGLVAGAALLVLLAAGALAAPWIAGDPARLDLERTLEPPSVSHPLGTDALGRDLASRVLHGGRVSLAVGLLSASVALLVGLPLGALAGSRGGAADLAVSRVVEAVACVPTLVLVLALLAAPPPIVRVLPQVLRIAAVLGLTGWIPVARYVRAEILRLRRSDMVAAATAVGGTPRHVVVRHLLPSALAPVLVTTAYAVGAAILVEAALSFLGMGVAPPIPTWGGLLDEAREQSRAAWWLVVFPGAALFSTVLACNLVGEGVRDFLDPRAGRGPA